MLLSILMTLFGLIAAFEGCFFLTWTNSILFIVTMVVIGCVCETLMAYSLMGYFQAEQRKN